MTKIDRQYRIWIAAAIQKARKSASGKVAYTQVSPKLNPYTAWSYTQWAVAAGWLHTDGQNVYETRVHQYEAITDILHELNNHKQDE